jgi:O-antigen ligase
MVLLPSQDGGSYAGQFRIDSPINFSIAGIIYSAAKLVDHAGDEMRGLGRVTLAANFSLFVITMYCFRQHFFSIGSEYIDTLVCSLLCLVFLIAPISWVHYLFFVCVAIAALFVNEALLGRKWRRLILLGAGIVLFQQLPFSLASSADLDSLFRRLIQTAAAFVTWMICMTISPESVHRSGAVARGK